MIQITPQMRVLVAVEAVDFRRGIDGLAQLCRVVLQADPFTGAVFVFRSRRRTAIKLLVYDGQGFWLCQKRLSKGTFRWWPSSGDCAATLQAHELQVLMSAGDPSRTQAAPMWRRVVAETEILAPKKDLRSEADLGKHMGYGNGASLPRENGHDRRRGVHQSADRG